MKELTTVLRAHAAAYPDLQPQDAVKLIYQNEFGPGHLIADPVSSLTRLQAEYASVSHDPAAPLLEDIGNGLVRVMLAALRPEEYPLEALNDAFVRSAGVHTGNRDSFLTKLDVLKDLTGQGLFSFSTDELDTYLRDYLAAGCPVVSHSPAYREAYRPAYRVVRRDSLPPLPVVLHAIRRHAAPGGRPLLVAIDGRCASGKTTLAAELKGSCECEVVPMDDFFLRPEQRTEARYQTPGENVDHERFLTEVLQPLSRGEPAVYQPFDCSIQQLTAPVRVPQAPVVIVEGSYSCHPALRPYYDLQIFLTVEPGEQMRRIITRNGAEYAEVFRSRWIPLEEAYFSAFPLAEQCDFCFET